MVSEMCPRCEQAGYRVAMLEEQVKQLLDPLMREKMAQPTIIKVHAEEYERIRDGVVSHKNDLLEAALAVNLGE